MRFSIERDRLLPLLRHIAGVVEKRQINSLPILSHVHIKLTDSMLTLKATDQEVELTCSVPMEDGEDVGGELALPFRKLNDICRALPDNTRIYLAEEGGRVLLRAGRSRYVVSAMPAESFPQLELSTVTHQLHLEQQALRNLLERSALAMAEQDVRYYLNGMLLEVREGALFAVAADGHRLAVNQLPLATDAAKAPFSVIVPRKGVLELLRILDGGESRVELLLAENHIRIKTTEGVTLTSKLLAGQFPDYKQVIPKRGDKVVISPKEPLKEAFYRASVLFNDKFRGVRLCLSQGMLKILAHNQERDEVEEDLEVDYQGDNLEIGFNVKYLLDFLGIIKASAVRLTFSDANNSALVEGVTEEGGIYVIMPMRI